MLIREAKQQVAEMQATVKALRKEYDDLSAKIKQISDNVLAAIDAQKEFGSITDEKARNAIALYSALLGMNQRAGADGTEAVRVQMYSALTHTARSSPKMYGEESVCAATDLRMSCCPVRDFMMNSFPDSTAIT